MSLPVSDIQMYAELSLIASRLRRFSYKLTKTESVSRANVVLTLTNCRPTIRNAPTWWRAKYSLYDVISQLLGSAQSRLLSDFRLPAQLVARYESL